MACLEFFLVVSAFSLFTEAAVPYKTAYFEQRVDHFNFVQALTYMQRYIYTGGLRSTSALKLFFLSNQINLDSFGMFASIKKKESVFYSEGPWIFAATKKADY